MKANCQREDKNNLCSCRLEAEKGKTKGEFIRKCQVNWQLLGSATHHRLRLTSNPDDRSPRWLTAPLHDGKTVHDPKTDSLYLPGENRWADSSMLLYLLLSRHCIYRINCLFSWESFQPQWRQNKIQQQLLTSAEHWAERQLKSAEQAETELFKL